MALASEISTKSEIIHATASRLGMSVGDLIHICL